MNFMFLEKKGLLLSNRKCWLSICCLFHLCYYITNKLIVCFQCNQTWGKQLVILTSSCCDIVNTFVVPNYY